MTVIATRHEVFDGVLFDMDGTLVSSIGAVDEFWHGVSQDLSLPPQQIAQRFAQMSGSRSIDVIRSLCPDKATWEYIHEMEARLPRMCAATAEEVPGACNFVNSVHSLGSRWGIVTSGSVPLVTGWLDVLKLVVPSMLVSGEDVEKGKPDPGPYLLGRGRLGLDEEQHRVLVCEDSTSGIKAAKAAGCYVIGVLSSMPLEKVVAAGADAVVRDWHQVKVVGSENGGFVLEITGDLR